MSTKLRNGLYLITPDDPDPSRLLARVQPLLPFSSCLQLRNKAMSAATLGEAGMMLRQACRDAGVPFIVNDDAALALELGADGVHLGEDDGDIHSARVLLGDDGIVGVSCYDDIKRARTLVAQGADY
ncbi:MAG: thiamine phosphate synthase, partial [Rhizobiaceae bacterium]